MDFSQRKLLLNDQYVWVVNTQDGKFGTFVGPSPLTDVKDEDIPLKPKGLFTDELSPIEGVMNAVQRCITIKDGQYVILHNPTESSGSQTPNGRWDANTRNPLPTILKGKKRVITDGSFPLWPTQWAELKSVHHLLANQFLMVEVESDKVDEEAPYYNLTVKCAKIKRAVVDESVDSKDEKDVQTTTDISADAEDESLKDEAKAEGGDEETSDKVETTKVSDTPEVNQAESEQESLELEEGKSESPFHIGQRIIIPGSMTERYIPPTGIKVVTMKVAEADEESENQVQSFNGDENEEIKRLINQGDITYHNFKEIMQRANLMDFYSDVLSAYRRHNEDYPEKNSLYEALRRNLESRDIITIIQKIQASVYKQPTSIEPISDDGAIQKAIVLGKTEFCVLIDEEGDPSSKEGPGRVFPGPYDTIRSKDSRGGVYDSYHIRPDRGILLRIVVNGISASEVCKLLPKGIEGEDFEDGKVFQKGDEIFIGGVDAYIVPHSIFEVIEPESRLPHIGNDHSNVYIKAIGVDQKSGVYVRNIETGNVALVKGEKKVLLDPRKSAHEHRRIPSEMWNLLIAHREPHKMSSSSIIETPWALSVQIPNNEAILITNKDGRRVVMGPKTELFEFEEAGEILTLSTGRRKSDANRLETCFLRVEGNRVTDTIDLITSDKIKITVEVQYGVRFVSKELRDSEKWFNNPDYIQLLVTRTRSLLRANAQLKSLMDLDKDMAGFIRDITLGVKTEGKHRDGLLFEENSMLVEEVDVLGYSIGDENVAYSLRETNRIIATRLIEDATKQAEIESDQLRETIAVKKADLEIAGFARIKKLDEERSAHQVALAIKKSRTDKTVAALTNSTENMTLALQHRRAIKEQTNSAEVMTREQEIADTEAILRRKREGEDHKLVLDRTTQQRDATVKFRNALVEIQKTIIETEGKIDVERLTAIQPKLIEAIEGLGNKQALTALAEHLPQAGGQFGFLMEAGGIAALKVLTNGTRFGKAIDALNDNARSLEHDNKTEEMDERE